MNNGAVRNVELTFADDGEFHSVVVSVPADKLVQYDRLIDLLREEPAVTKGLYLDLKRLVSAAVVEEGEEG